MRLSHRLALVFLAAAAALRAQNTIHVPADQPTIQAGINAANNGDTVLVAPGTYYENINLKGKAITVTSSGGAAVTTIDGGGAGSAITISTNEKRTTVVSNFTITHGGFLNSATNLTPAAGISMFGTAPTILNNIITQNYCQNIQGEGSGPLIQGNVISSSLNPAKCSVVNTGGINLGGSSSTPPQIIGNTIENNTTGQIGDGGGDGGAGIWINSGANIAIVGNIIRNNTTVTGLGGGIFTVNANILAIVDNLIYGNFSGCGGGGIAYDTSYASSTSTFIIANNTLVDNTTNGKSIYSNCDPAAQIYPGAVSYGIGPQRSAIINNVISGSTSIPSINCGYDATATASGQPEFQNNIFYNSGGAIFGSTCADVSTQYNNIAAAPQFANSANYDYHLTSTSPAIDSGQNGVLQTVLAITGLNLSTDFDANPRVQDAKGGGCIIDMGAYEYPGTKSVCGTAETLQSSLNPSNYGQVVTFTAQLSSTAGVPTGDVQFADGSIVLGTETISSAGVSTFATSSLAVGTHSITATYQPTGVFAASTASLSQVVNGSATSTTLTCSPRSIYINASAQLTAMVTSSNGTPTGSITFTDNGSTFAQAALINGGVSLSYTGPSAGTHTLTATYVPTGSFAASSASCSEVVSLYPSTTTLVSSLNPSSADQNVTFTATVTFAFGVPAPAMTTVVFADGGTRLGVASLVATASPSVFTATYSTAALAVGTHDLSATLAPPTQYAVSSASMPQVVNALPTTSVLSVNPIAATVGSPVVLTATVNPVSVPGPTGLSGAVTFYSGTTLLGTATVASGVASLTTSILPVGTDQLTCTYSGDAIYAPSNCNTVPAVISPLATTLTLVSSNNPAPALTAITFTAHLATGTQPEAGNTITLSINGQVVSFATDANGNATFTVSTLTPGSYPVAANFAATTNLLGSSASLTQVVTINGTSTVLTSSLNPAYQGQTVTLTATVTAANGVVPSGNVTFLDGGSPLSTVMTNAQGVAAFSTTTLAVGKHLLTATYAGTPSFSGSLSNTVQEFIFASTFAIALSPTTITIPPGQQGTDGILLTSVGIFAGPLALTYGTLPQYATASISPATVTLSAGGTGNSTLTLNTIAFQSRAEPGSRGLSVIVSAMLLLFAPFGLHRRRLARLALVVVAAGLMQALIGCTNAWYKPNVVAAGTYQLPITATDVNGNMQTATLTVVVTAQ